MIKKNLIVILYIILFANLNLYGQQSLFIGLNNHYQDTVITGANVQYDTIAILNNASLSFENSNVTTYYTVIVTDSAKLTVKNCDFTAFGSCVFYGNSQTRLQDTLNLNCNLICGASAVLDIDSADVSSNMSYIGQYELLGFDYGRINIKNSSFDLNNGKFGGGFLNHAVLDQYNNQYTSSVGIAMTLGFNGSSQLFVDQCSGGMEIIMNDSANIDLDNSQTFILWFGFGAGDTANIDLPATNGAYPPSSTVSNYTFSAALPNVQGVGINLDIANCSTIYWAVLLYPECDITMNNDSLIATGLYYYGSVTDSLIGFVNSQTYSSYSPGLSDRTFDLINSQVLAWNFYPGDHTKIIIKDCHFGEVLTFNDAKAEVINSTCDGTGGYFGASENSNIYAKNSVIERTYNGPDIILHKDSSFTVLENCEVIGNITLNKNTKHIHNNTIHNDNLTVNEAAYFLNVFLDTIYNAFTDSTVEISGSLFNVKGVLNMDFMSGFKLSYSMPDTSNMITIVDSSCTPYFANSTIYNWNTNNITQGNYILWLSVFLNGDSLVSASREIFLQDPASRQDHTKPDTNFKVFPNPAKNYITINIVLREKSDLKIIITDISGKIIQEQLIKNAKRGAFITKINLKEMDTGAYNITCTVNNHSLGTKKLLVK